MKVLIFGSGELDCAAANCGIALRRMGHEVRHFDPFERAALPAAVRRSWMARFVVERALSVAFGDHERLYSSALVRDAARFGPDLVLVLPITLLSPGTVRALRRTGSKVAGWFQDAFVNFGRHRFMLAEYDGLFFKDPYIVERLRDFAGMDTVHHLPEACEPGRHRPLPITEADRGAWGCDLAFYGNLYPYRMRVLNALSDLPVDLRLYGGRPPRWLQHPVLSRWQGREVYFDDKVRSVLCAKIVVNNCHFGEVRSVNARTFEVAGIGGFQVTDAPAVADYFEPGREIAVFRGPAELREVIFHYLERPVERAEMAERARERAHREHTYQARLAELLSAVGLERGDTPRTSE